MGDEEMHVAAVRYYRDQEDCSALMYRHYTHEVAQELIPYAMEWSGWQPPRHVLQHLWDHQDDQCHAFFCSAVFRHADIWAGIVRQLIEQRRWKLLGCAAATQPEGWHGHVANSQLYADALLREEHMPGVVMRLGATFVPPHMLQSQHMQRIVHWMDHGHFADAILWLNRLDRERLACVAGHLVAIQGVDHLLEQIVGRPELEQALRDCPHCTSEVALLVRPLAQLSDHQMHRMATRYAGTPLARLEWHTELLKRKLPLPYFVGADHMPMDEHQLLHYVVLHGQTPVGAQWAVASALRKHPEACANSGVDLRAELQRHRGRCSAQVRAAGAWPLPDEIRDGIALYL